MTSNVLPLHFAPSQASSSQNSNVDSYLQYCEVGSLKLGKSKSSLHIILLTFPEFPVMPMLVELSLSQLDDIELMEI